MSSSEIRKKIIFACRSARVQTDFKWFDDNDELTFLTVVPMAEQQQLLVTFQKIVKILIGDLQARRENQRCQYLFRRWTMRSN